MSALPQVGEVWVDHHAEDRVRITWTGSYSVGYRFIGDPNDVTCGDRYEHFLNTYVKEN